MWDLQRSVARVDSIDKDKKYTLNAFLVELKNVDQQRPSDLHIRQTTENMGPCGLDFIWQINTYRSNEKTQWLVHFYQNVYFASVWKPTSYYYGEEICSQKMTISTIALMTNKIVNSATCV